MFNFVNFIFKKITDKFLIALYTWRKLQAFILFYLFNITLFNFNFISVFSSCKFDVFYSWSSSKLLYILFNIIIYLLNSCLYLVKFLTESLNWLGNSILINYKLFYTINNLNYIWSISQQLLYYFALEIVCLSSKNINSIVSLNYILKKSS